MSVDIDQAALSLYGYYRVSRSPAWDDLDPVDREAYRSTVRRNREQVAEVDQLRGTMREIADWNCTIPANIGNPEHMPTLDRNLIIRMARKSLGLDGGDEVCADMVAVVATERDRCAQMALKHLTDCDVDSRYSCTSRRGECTFVVTTPNDRRNPNENDHP